MSETIRLSQLSHPLPSLTAIVIALVIGFVVGHWVGTGNRSPRYQSVELGFVLDTKTGLYCSPYTWEDKRGYPPCSKGGQ